MDQFSAYQCFPHNVFSQCQNHASPKQNHKLHQIYYHSFLSICDQTGPTDLGSNLICNEDTHHNSAQHTKKYVGWKNKQSKKNTHMQQNLFSSSRTNHTAKVGRILSLKQSKKKGNAPWKPQLVVPTLLLVGWLARKKKKEKKEAHFWGKMHPLISWYPSKIIIHIGKSAKTYS